jgi:hypothetical protein
MNNWRELGSGWTYSTVSGEGYSELWLRHQCRPDKMAAGRADESHEVVSLEPLTLSPSVVCACGAHGYVKAGQWEPC